MALVKRKPGFGKKTPSSSALARAVKHVLKQELKDDDLLARIQQLFDLEVGQQVFCVGDSPPAPWQPPKPLLSRLVLEAFVSSAPLPDGKPVVMPSLVIGPTTMNLRLYKIVARRAIEFVIANHRESLQASGELKGDLFADDAKLYASISRIGADVLGAIARRAAEAVQGKTDMVVEVHDSSNHLGGRETRGFGLVVCQKGRQLVEQIVRDLLQEGVSPESADA
jgi:hypothetical protein